MVEGDEGINLRNPRYLSAFHPHGYNNQPHFISEDRLLISSDYKSLGKPRIWQLQPFSGVMHLPLTDRSLTYSPMIHPDGKSLCMVWVRDTEGPEQYVFCGSNAILPLLGNAGYYAWKNSDTIALYLIGEFPKLVLADVRTGDYSIISTNPGRSFHFDKNNRLIHVHKLSTGTWYLRSYNPRTRKSDILLRTPDESEDFCLMPDGSVLMATGSILLRMDPTAITDWNIVTDLSVYGLSAISRLAVSEQLQLALVNEVR